MNAGQVIKQRIFKNNRVIRKNEGSDNNDSFLTISQSFIKPLRTILLPRHFQNRYFLMLGTVVQGLVFFVLSALEQACLLNGAD